LTAEAAAISAAAEAYLRSERRGFNMPEPEVEAAVRAIPDDAPVWLQTLAGRGITNIRASAIAWRHIAAGNCHSFEREKYEDRPVDENTTKTIKVEDEDAINTWIRTQPDAVVMALIRENALWLRNAAVADRICRWRLQTLDGDTVAQAFLRQLAGHQSRKGHPQAGPRFPSLQLRQAIEAVEADRGTERELWLKVREESDAKATLLGIGETWWWRKHGWDAARVAWWKDNGRRSLKLTGDQAVMHLGRHLVIVRDTNDDRWVVIDDEGWPRAVAVALLAARWKVSKGWVLKKLAVREK